MRFSLAVLLLPLVSALPRSVVPQPDGLQKFTLVADYTAPERLSKLGPVSWLGSGRQAIGGAMGWWDEDKAQTDAVLFIQYNKKKGIAFDSTKTSRTLYLKQENRDGLRELVLGSPSLERNPKAMLEKDWTIDATMITPGEPHYWLGYQGKHFDMWSACDTVNGWKLYYGKVDDPADGCTDNFDLEVMYVGGNPKCC